MQETHVGKKVVYFNVNEELKKRLKMTLETTVGGGGKTKKRWEVKKEKKKEKSAWSLNQSAKSCGSNSFIFPCGRMCKQVAANDSNLF